MMTSRLGVERDASDASRRVIMTSPLLFLFVFVVSNVNATGKLHSDSLSLPVQLTSINYRVTCNGLQEDVF